jgi:DNA-binding LytR/AlgR family response regulator
MNILIIEDEPLVARNLINLVKNLEPTAHISGPVASVAAAVDWFSSHPAPDLVLSDIQLSDGISFEIFEKNEITSPVIFTTAYDEYAIRAFKINSIDYLLKPIDKKELESAVKKYKSLTDSAAVGDEVRELLLHWNKPEKKYKRRFLSQQRNSLVPIPEDTIAFFHKQELVFIHTVTNEKFIADHNTLDEIESLVDPEKFFRVNRQYLVHIQAVAKITATHKGMNVMLKPPASVELELSREKITPIKKWMS